MERIPGPRSSRALAQATAYIVIPLTGRQVGFARLFRTHPPTVDRVDRLMALHPSIASNGIGVSS